jgi:hypothetical protein
MQLGVFDSYFADHQDLAGMVNDRRLIFAQRRCPNPDCLAHVFVVFDEADGVVLAAYPTELIDFDASHIPEAVSESLNEALICHANGAMVAAAIMIRKTLEELCADRGAEGADLKARIASLRTTVVLPQELFDGLDELRLLGNDAAHVESRTYNDVGQEEVEVSIDFAREVLKATYQYGAMLDRIRGLRSE